MIAPHPDPSTQPVPGSVSTDPQSGIRDLSVASPRCKLNMLTWKRPLLRYHRCGTIKKYRVFRNDREIGSTDGDAPVCNHLDEERIHRLPRLLSGPEEEIVDEGSTHVYRVRGYDAEGFAVADSPEITHVNPTCPDGPYEVRVNATLITFADLIDRRCADYPCIFHDPPGAPFTSARAEADIYGALPHSQPPVSWLIQKQAPNKSIRVTGTVRGWVVLRERTHYCQPPFMAAQCSPQAVAQVISDAVSGRGSMPSPHIDMLYVFGMLGWGSRSAGNRSEIWDPRSTATASGMLFSDMMHEMGHVGYFDDISLEEWHSYSLLCPAGQPPIGSDLGDLTKDGTGTPGRCLMLERGDRLDQMSDALGSLGFGAHTRWRLGLLDRRDVLTVPRSVAVSSVTLEHLNAPSSPESSHVKLARIALQNDPEDAYYILEYRGGSPEFDWRPNCRAGDSECLQYGGVPIERGVYVRLKPRHQIDTGQPLGHPIPTLALVRDITLQNRFGTPVHLDADHPLYCDPRRQLFIRLEGFEPVGGVDSARVSVVRTSNCPPQ
ncbi:MAG: hypothetical protein HY079_09265 [Elusimicrobia bacterium]|nr:hypothetical protein [Elusimicrobiota bacterium]